MNVAIIPARGGSTRVPKKNVKIFCGKPMIAYPIQAAKDSGLFDQIVVSTDSPEIADVAKSYGAKVPFMRPDNLSVNAVNVADVVHHALTWLKNNGQQPQFACSIVATAAFLRCGFLKEGYEAISRNDVDSVVSVTKFPFPIYRAFEMTPGGRLKFRWPEYELAHSNNLPDMYHDAAQFYWLNVDKFLVTKSLMGKNVMPVIIPEYLARDIDTPEDWETAEFMFEACQRKGSL